MGSSSRISSAWILLRFTIWLCIYHQGVVFTLLILVGQAADINGFAGD